MPKRSNFKWLLTDKIYDKGMSLRTVEQAVDAPVNSLARITTGKGCELKLVIAERICSLLNISPADLQDAYLQTFGRELRLVEAYKKGGEAPKQSEPKLSNCYANSRKVRMASALIMMEFGDNFKYLAEKYHFKARILLSRICETEEVPFDNIRGCRSSKLTITDAADAVFTCARNHVVYSNEVLGLLDWGRLDKVIVPRFKWKPCMFDAYLNERKYDLGKRMDKLESLPKQEICAALSGEWNDHFGKLVQTAKQLNDISNLEMADMLGMSLSKFNSCCSKKSEWPLTAIILFKSAFVLGNIEAFSSEIFSQTIYRFARYAD